MFKLLNKILGRKQEELQYENIASVTYYVDLDGNLKIDMEMNSYDDSSIDAMSSILRLLAHDSSFVQTVEFLRDAMFADNEKENFIKILLPVSEILSQKMQKKHDDAARNTPCIKPYEAK